MDRIEYEQNITTAVVLKCSEMHVFNLLNNVRVCGVVWCGVSTADTDAGVHRVEEIRGAGSQQQGVLRQQHS